MRSVLLGHSSRATLAIAACALAIAIPATADAATPGTVTRLPEGSVLSGRQASNLTLGGDGRIWFGASTSDASGPASNGVIGIIDESSGVISSATDPAGSVGGIFGPIVSDSGHLWFTPNLGAGSNHFDYLNIADCTVADYGGPIAMPASKVALQSGPAGSAIYKISANSFGQAAIGKVTPSGVRSESQTGLTNEMAVGSLAAAGGDTWFSESKPNASHVIETGIAKLSSATGLITEHPVPAWSATAGSRWTVSQMIAGPDGNIWVVLKPVSPNTTYAIGVYPLGGGPAQWTVTPGRAISNLQAGLDGNLWATETWTPAGKPSDQKSSAILKMSTGGVYSEFPLANGHYAINKPVLGPDGNLWVAVKACTLSTSCGADSTRSWFQRVSTGGAAVEFDTGLPTDSEHIPGEMVAGSDNRIWFIDNWTADGVAHGAIARFELSTTPPVTVVPSSTCRYGFAGNPTTPNPPVTQVTPPAAALAPAAAIVKPSSFSRFAPAALFLTVSAKAGKKLVASVAGVADGTSVRTTWRPKSKKLKTITAMVPVKKGALKIIVPKKKGDYVLTISLGKRKLASHGVTVK
jgi:hypothetical protein